MDKLRLLVFWAGQVAAEKNNTILYSLEPLKK
jgi:hypothetical protein